MKCTFIGGVRHGFPFGVMSLEQICCLTFVDPVHTVTPSSVFIFMRKYIQLCYLC
jgi:hypothetical protein